MIRRLKRAAKVRPRPSIGQLWRAYTRGSKPLARGDRRRLRARIVGAYVTSNARRHR